MPGGVWILMWALKELYVMNTRGGVDHDVGRETGCLEAYQ